MEEVIAVSFRDRRRAAQAFNLLWQMNDKLVIELDDAIVVHRDRSGNLEYDQDVASTLGRTPIRSGFWGAVVGALVGASIAVVAQAIHDPTVLWTFAMAGGTVGMFAGALNAAEKRDWWKPVPCVPKDLIQEVVQDMPPNDSALVAWVDSAGLTRAAPAFRGLGGTVLRTTLAPEDTAELESVLKR